MSSAWQKNALAWVGSKVVAAVGGLFVAMDIIRRRRKDP
jgi:hypothetical protein